MPDAASLTKLLEETKRTSSLAEQTIANHMRGSLSDEVQGRELLETMQRQKAALQKELEAAKRKEAMLKKQMKAAQKKAAKLGEQAAVAAVTHPTPNLGGLGSWAGVSTPRPLSNDDLFVSDGAKVHLHNPTTKPPPSNVPLFPPGPVTDPETLRQLQEATKEYEKLQAAQASTAPEAKKLKRKLCGHWAYFRECAAENSRQMRIHCPHECQMVDKRVFTEFSEHTISSLINVGDGGKCSVKDVEALCAIWDRDAPHPKSHVIRRPDSLAIIPQDGRMVSKLILTSCDNLDLFKTAPQDKVRYLPFGNSDHAARNYQDLPKNEPSPLGPAGLGTAAPGSGAQEDVQSILAVAVAVVAVGLATAIAFGVDILSILGIAFSRRQQMRLATQASPRAGQRRR